MAVTGELGALQLGARSAPLGAEAGSHGVAVWSGYTGCGHVRGSGVNALGRRHVCCGTGAQAAGVGVGGHPGEFDLQRAVAGVRRGKWGNCAPFIPTGLFLRQYGVVLGETSLAFGGFISICAHTSHYATSLRTYVTLRYCASHNVPSQTRDATNQCVLPALLNIQTYRLGIV